MGYEIARSLNAPLDVFIVRKLGAPGRPELGFGAVAQGGLRALNPHIIRALDITESYVKRVVEEETAEIESRLRLLRGDRPEPEVRGRIAILVDDGLATGATALAAIHALRGRGPRRLVLAVPVCAAPAAKTIHPVVDELVCLQMPTSPTAVGLWYRSFEQVPDEEVIELLEDARPRPAE